MYVYIYIWLYDYIYIFWCLMVKSPCQPRGVPLVFLCAGAKGACRAIQGHKCCGRRLGVSNKTQRGTVLHNWSGWWFQYMVSMVSIWLIYVNIWIMIWLVVSTPLTSMKVNWDDDIPHGKIKKVPNYQPVMKWWDTSVILTKKKKT